MDLNKDKWANLELPMSRTVKIHNSYIKINRYRIQGVINHSGNTCPSHRIRNYSSHTI